MFISKKRHYAVVDEYERRLAALEIKVREWRDAFHKEAFAAHDAEEALETALAATEVTIRNADARADAADAALARYLEDYAPRKLQAVS